MNSETFFKEEANKWKGKTGIYVISQPLIKKNGEDIFKVGYAMKSLYTRIRDYKTAYSIAPFKIWCIWYIPNVVGEKGRLALQTEKRIHKSLKSELVMKDDITDEQAGEWFLSLYKILGVIYGIRTEYLSNPNMIRRKVSEWDFYIHESFHKIYTRSMSKDIVSKDEIKTSLPTMIERKQRKKRTTKP